MAMESDVHTLFNVLNSYKQSVIENLNKIDDNIYQAVNNHENTYGGVSIEKKYKLSIEMVKVLQTYVKMLYTSESLFGELKTKLDELERDSQPEKGRRWSNPFTPSLFDESKFFPQFRVAFEDVDKPQPGPSSFDNNLTIKVSPNLNEISEKEKKEPLCSLKSVALSSLDTSFVAEVNPKQKTNPALLLDEAFSHHSDSDDTIQPEINHENVKVEIVEDPVESTDFEETVENEVETPVEAKVETPIVARVETPVVARVETPVVATVETPVVARVETPVVARVETPVVSRVETPVEAKVETPVVARVETPVVARVETPVVARVETPVEAKVETPVRSTDLEIVENKVHTPVAVKVETLIESLEDKVELLFKKPSEKREVSRPKSASPKKSKKPEIPQFTYKKSARKVTFSTTHSTGVKNEKSAEKKLMEMPPYDRRQEGVRVSHNKIVKKNFTLKAVPKSRLLQVQTKEKCAIFDVADNELKVHMNCIICHVETPLEFYVRTEQEMFEQLESNFNEYMNDHYNYVVNKYKSKSDAETHLGNFCFAFLADRRKWYRIEVIDWMDDDVETIVVQLIDYGQSIYLSYKNLKSMNETYAAFPRMAIQCHLAAIYSTDVESKAKWHRSSIDYFIQLAEMTKKTQFKVIFAHKEGDSYATDFAKLGDEDPPSLGALLVNAGYAFSVDIKDSENFLDTIDENFDECDNINEAIAGYDARDESRICPFTDRSGRCFKGPRCKLEHSKLSEDGITTDKILTTNQAVAEFPLPPSGSHVKVLITGYIDTCHFYAHILHNCEEDSHYNTDFKNLKEAMKANNLVQTYEPFKISPTISELLLVKEGLEWHRGNCVGYADNDSIEVFFVDYGFTRLKKLNDLRQMREDFLYVPFQAIECILSDCQEKSDTHIVHSRNFFDRCMKGQKIDGLVVDSKTNPISLQLWDTEGEMPLSYSLIQFGIGEPRTDLRPTKNSILSAE